MIYLGTITLRQSVVRLSVILGIHLSHIHLILLSRKHYPSVSSSGVGSTGAPGAGAPMNYFKK